MRASVLLKTVLINILCVSLGLLMAYSMIDNDIWKYIQSKKIIHEAYGLVNLPGLYLAEIWHFLKLPPTGDAALMLYPYAIGVQWVFIGLIISFLYFLFSTRNPKQY